ncbi:MAG: nucleoside-triphosphatase [Thermodesulfobacteriota bacterium]
MTADQKLRILLTGPPRCGKTTVVQKVVHLFTGKAAGFYTREVRERGERVGFEIVTLDGRVAGLSHVDFPGPLRVGRYGVDLDGFHRLALPAMAYQPGIELIIVDEIGKMECLSSRFVEAMERLWAAPAPLLVTVAEKGGGYIQTVKEKPDKNLITITPAIREQLPEKILKMFKVIRD